MNINFTWVKEKALNEIDIFANPENRAKLERLEKLLQQEQEIVAIDPKNNRSIKLPLDQIVSFETMGHLVNVHLINQQNYLMQKRLKELVTLESQNFYRINNSQILNLSCVQSFQLGEHARLEVHTKTDSTYIVSRHYAKKIKEELSCSNN
ncbi:LytTR family DNA-binding domain-containing protein [Enterococcus avium]|uniref:LytTR family DNA-binding domain-containing protein n=1 Tax=Enterococcus avium TaxID=33945 RepID=A0ABD5F6T6_ENTAV|nr:LytTR family DNA-binding domain-containing protein [Enterococcus avium]MDT2436585.1 LytTR family DNA-binding domain-containing protein [Enterococcus avium]MDT2466741.1 LytTR family DNA-binding domain-containing protein [Enterococcus avium]MDT2482202.1 LytTR family DNA-binding domain-containing protein [Enterococcus avium]MDT2506179.1 LytTR family DNA-binding domain-containing protein [Enterococcus avium]MDT2508775.1 LytTR family DNA-binding domain-containing protein [Enterococcus avium]